MGCDSPSKRKARLKRPPFFQRSDWSSFGLATVIALIVYLYTLSPEVTLEWSGIYAAAAKYGGVGPPPGYPTWTIYAWIFTKILPFSNIAWRVAVSSAVAGAMTAGVIAMMVSRGSATLLAGTRAFARLPEREESWLRVVSGVVAGLGFAFHNNFWNSAVIVESAALGMLLMSTVLCLLLCWAHSPRQNSYLYAAAFLFGLTLTVRVSLAALAPALPLVVLFMKRSIGRDLLLLIAASLGLALWGSKAGWLPKIIQEAGQFPQLWTVYLIVAVAYAIVGIFLAVKTRRMFSRGGQGLIVMAMVLCGLSFYFYIAIASMTNPPVNWGYARTTEGFIHLISRGQFEHSNPMNLISEPGRFFYEVWGYGSETFRGMGWIYVFPAMVPFLFLRRMRGRARRWLFGLLVCFLALSLIMVVILNMPPDRDAWAFIGNFCTASHLVLTIFAGYGLVFLGTLLARERQRQLLRRA